MVLQQLLLILLIHQHYVCHGSWATRTNATAAAGDLTSTPSLQTTTPLVSASVATLLTNKIFSGFSATRKKPNHVEGHFDANGDANNFGHDNEIGTTSLSSSSFFMLPAKKPVSIVPNTETINSSATTIKLKEPNKSYKVLSTRTNCTRDLFEIYIKLNRSFRGLLYAKDFSLECRSRGTSHSNITLRLPTSSCGVRAERSPGGTMELSVRVMLQMEKKLRQSTDILRTMRCKLPMNAMGMTLVAGEKVIETFRNGRMGTISSNNETIDTTKTVKLKAQQYLNDVKSNMQKTVAISSSTTNLSSLTPRVRIWLELGGPDGSGAVEVGQATTLTVRAIVPGTMGVRVIDCAALDGLGESTQQLLDDRGCAIDEQVMPALHNRFQPAEEGWSKQNEDDLVEKMFTSTFPAFKFPDRERLHVSCGVQLCKGKCPNIDCLTAEKFVLSKDKHLARIEVYNSLAVTAPQIEVDSLRYDQRYNMSAENYSAYFHPLPSEGTLCLSVSKLAFSFCVLGLIFLIAIMVAICSVIRSRRCAASGSNKGSLTRQEVCTSMFSSSSDSTQSVRFGSKLFLPYYPNTLPYGRVY